MNAPLDGIRVLDLTIFQNGPWATVMLSDMGAEVIKIEDPVNGDPARVVHQALIGPGQIDVYFETMNRNKKSMTLNLKVQEGREIFYALAKKADVVVQNFRVGVAEKLGVGYDEIKKHNPKIVYASASGFGPKGPDATDGVFDILGQARGGFMYLNSIGEPHVIYRSNAALADQLGAIVLSQGVLLGLMARERYGIGQQVEVSQLGAQMILQALAINGWLINGNRPRGLNRKEGTNPLFCIYKCADAKWIALGCPQFDRYWPGACKALNIPELEHDPRYATIATRQKNSAAMIEFFDNLFATKPRHEWIKALKQHGILCAPVQDYEDLSHDPQVLANEYLADVPHPSRGTLKEMGIPIKLSATPGRIGSSAPQFGQNTEGLLLADGYTWEQLEQFRANGIV